MSNTILKYGEPNFLFKNNELNRLTYSIVWVPILTIIKYFSNYENLYFLFLAIFQLSTLVFFPKEWSPTGPYSTAIPLFICIIIEILIDAIKWCKIYFQDQSQNNREIKYFEVNTCTISNIKNKNLFPGHVIYLEKNNIAPADGLLVDTDDDHAKISLSLLTGESTLIYVKKFDSTFNYLQYLNRLIDITQLDQKQIIPSGSIIKSKYVYLWITKCGHHNYSNKNIQKKSSIDNFIGTYMSHISVFLLLVLVLIVSFLKIIFIKSSTNIFLQFIFFTIQNWIIFNNIIPFSVKILLIFARKIQGIIISDKNITVNESLQIDDFDKIKRIISDKTGTITKNELELVKIISKHDSLPNDISNLINGNLFHHCLVMCIHYDADNNFSTPEDNIIFSKIDTIENSKKFGPCMNILK